MGKENKSYRINTKVSQDRVVNFSIDNTIETLEILSLKIDQKSVYRLMGSNTGIVAGRVLANGGFGVPNTKVSVFIEYEDTNNIEQRILYNYTTTRSYNSNGIRYNLLPDNVDDECHQNIGSFPSKRVLLDNNSWIDIFDKYYKLTTRTNEAGDYMIYGVPTGNQIIHMDVDMSDIGVLSQKPRDMIHNGYNGNMFESPTKFKVDTNLDSLAQVRTQDQTVYVYPFWGDTTDSSLNASITRCDMNINYKFEPTCIFMGSVITDTGENAMTEECVAAENQGKMADMVTGEGKIEMIRKTPNGQIEQFSVNGDNNINGDGVWCYQIPMNLDYVMHDEYGKMVMTDNPNIGIPTRARVRFRLSMAESPSDAIAKKRARFLIPNNPHLIEEDYPNYCETKEIDYEFGTKTKDENFRDLFWNNVYTVKSYIPRIQESKQPNSLEHLGIKCVNHPGGHNPMPFNNLRIKFNFVYMFLCTLVKVLVQFVGAINSVLTFISWIIWKIGTFFFDAAKAVNVEIPIIGHPFNWLAKIFAEYNGHGVRDNDGISVNDYLVKVWEDVQNDSKVCGGIAAWFIRIFLGIGCGITLRGLCETDDGESIDVSPGTNDNVRDLLKEKNIMACDDSVDALYNCIENQLAQDNEVTRFNFYNDWVNGVVYLPLWHREITKKRSYLFGLITIDAVNEWCATDNTITKKRAYKKDILLYNTNVPQRKISKGTAKTMGTISPLVNNEDTVIASANDETGHEDLLFLKENDENCYGYQCHKDARTYFRIYKGLVYEKETSRGDKVYYYRPCDYDPSTGNSDLVTLFATDLVLLGSLNDCDIHGIPQFFKTLESTTYNMPPDLLSEHYDYVSENSEEIDLGSRATEYTGADWGNLGVDQSNYSKEVLNLLGSTYYANANENQYDNGGLFYGLTCFDSYTKPKSCINLSRICELGVSLDGSHMLLSNDDNGTDNNVEALTPDGFISYDEIYNPDYRSMFATLNGNFLKTKLNPETGLLEYDFNHTYIDNFDGSLKQLMKAKTVNGYTEKSNFEKKANYINNHNLEISSDAYLSFRYGNYVKKNGYKIYYYENTNGVGNSGPWYTTGYPIYAKNRQPRYENSFYFYFGLNEGKTAIDKFNTEFFSDCTNNFASDSPYDLSYQGNSWCPMNSSDGFVAFNMNVEPPYSVKFTNKDTNDVYSQDNISSEKFIFCDPAYMPREYDYNKYIPYTLEKNGNSGEVCYVMPNGPYTIELIDGYDNSYTDNFTFESSKIGFVCDVNPFTRKNSELVSKFSDNEFKTIAQTYTNIANYAKFIDDNMDIDMDALRYSLYEPGYIIKRTNTYYTKDNLGYHPSVASADITVLDGDEYYYYHEPKLDRDIRGFVALSGITEDNFKIEFKPIDIDFFGSNYNGTSINVHVTYNPYVGGTTIPLGETYYLLDNGKYEPMVAQDDITVPDDNEDTELYTKAIVDVTENPPNTPYVKYRAGATIPNGSKYYHYDENNDTYTETLATSDITVPDPNNNYYYKVDNCGYLGYIILDGVITHYFGVPYGGKRYKIRVTQLCENDEHIWEDTKNVTIINVIVYEDEFKMYINSIDYDLIQKFKAGWTDDKLIDGEFKDDNGNYSVFIKDDNNDDKIYGWDDILNIGEYNYHGDKKLSQIQYMRYGSASTDHTDLEEVLAICKVLHTEYEDNASGENNGETPYNWYGDYCYDAPSNTPNDYYKGVVDKRTYTYTISQGVTLYDIDGNIVLDNQIIHGNVYYIDDTHTVEAEIGVDYTEVATEEQIDVTRYDYRINYLDYADNEYLYDGNTYRYTYPFNTLETKTGIVNGYPNGIKVNMFRRTLRIRDGITLYKDNGGTYIPVTSMELIPNVEYYKYNGSSYVRAYEYPTNPSGDYILYSPVISYELDSPLYRAEFREGDDELNGEILVNEDNDGVLTYKTENNVEYNDLGCLTFYDYRNFIDSINTVIENRNEFVRNVGGTFRINENETTLTLTTKTKAKPVKYLIIGSLELSVFENLYNYRPTKKLRQVGNNSFSPVKFNDMSDINNTSYASVTSIKNVSNGYVVDKNLETQAIGFSLPTLTYDYDFVEYQSNEIIYNGDVYYSEEVIAYPSGTILEIGTECYWYHPDSSLLGASEYYEWVQLTREERAHGDDYFYTTGEKVKNTAVITNDSGVLPIRPGSTTTNMQVIQFIPYAHTTSTIWKKATTNKQYLPYYSNKYKHPYYVSVMNDNDSVIPPGKDLSNFTDFGGNKNLKTAFGVHFYNKPLKSDFKMILSFLNNIPAYPMYSLGDNTFSGTGYTMSSFKYYNYEYPDDNTITIPEDTIVYGYNNTITESDEIVLLQEYYLYTVEKIETDTVYIRYVVGDVIYEEQTYYTKDRFSGIFVKHVAETTFTVNDLLTAYYYTGETIENIKTKIAALMGNGVSPNDVGLRGHNFILCNDTTEYEVYNGDIIYYNEYIPYPGGTTIQPNESFYERNGRDNSFILKQATQPILVPTFNIQYFKDEYMPRLTRHIVNMQNYESKQITEYIKNNRSLGYLRDAFYPYKDTINRGRNSINTLDLTVDISMYILIDRYGYNYISGTPERGNYYYSLSDDCCKNDTVTNRKWKARLNDNGITSYNNIGAYRYHSPQLTRLILTKRTEASPLEPLYTSNGDGYYTEVGGYGYVPYSSNTRISVGQSYYRGKKTYVIFNTLYDGDGNIVNVNDIQPGAIYYTSTDPLRRNIANYAQNGDYFWDMNESNITYTKVNVSNISGRIIVPVGNDDSNSQYYKTYCHGTPIPSDANYYGLYIYGTANTTYIYYNTDNVVSSSDVTKDWEPVDVFMPGFMTGYVYNGIPRSDSDKTNIKAQLNETEINLYTPDTSDNPDVYENINVRRLIYTPNSEYNSDNPATYGTYSDLEPASGLNYQYIEVPLVDEEFIYTDGYGDDYRKMVLGTLSVVFDNPVFTYFNLGRTYKYVRNHLDYEDYIKTKTFYTSDDGYVKHQTLYYIFDLDKTDYPLYYYDTGDSSLLNSKLKYDKERNRFYFTEIPELLLDIDNSNYISKSKSTDFSVWSYIRKKYGQVDNNSGDGVEILPLEVDRPKDKFFAIACVDGYYAISPVIETQKFLTVLNYNGFDNRYGSSIYITARDSRNRSSEESMRRNIHYIEDMYYMLYYRFVVHVAYFDYNEQNENARYSSDVYTQICSVSEGTAQHCYIRVDDKDEDYTYWASAIKLNLSSLGVDAMDSDGKILSWLQIVIEDASGGLRVSSKQTSGDNPNKGVNVTEFEDYATMVDNYNSSQSINS